MFSGIMRSSSGQAITLISPMGYHIRLMQLVKNKITKKEGLSRKTNDSALLITF